MDSTTDNFDPYDNDCTTPIFPRTPKNLSYENQEISKETEMKEVEMVY